MKRLSEFLARYVIDREDYFGANVEKEYEEMIAWYAEDLNKGIEAYKKHLQNDRPKTVQWAMIEKNLISALDKMESHSHSTIHNGIHDVCAAPELRSNFGCAGYEQSNCIMREPEQHEADCASHNNPPAGFASSVSDCNCKIKHPICPLNFYFEGDEDKIDLKNCDFKNRSCSQMCELPIDPEAEDNIETIKET